MIQPEKVRPGNARRHHFVPRCWLAGFTASGRADGVLCVTDIERQKQWQTTPEHAGHMRDFYRLSDLSSDPLVIEKFLAEQESQVAPLFRSINAEPRVPTIEELDLILQFMAYQWVRVPSFRRFALGILWRVLGDKMGEALSSPQRWKAVLKEIGVEDCSPGSDYCKAKRFWESRAFTLKPSTDWYIHRALLLARRTAVQLRKRHWQSYITRFGRLVASDNPVVLDGPQRTKIGFKNAEVILYPVSRHVFLQGTLKPVARSRENFNYFSRFNTMLLLRSQSQVYSHVPDFSWLNAKETPCTDWRVFSRDDFAAPKITI